MQQRNTGGLEIKAFYGIDGSDYIDWKTSGVTINTYNKIYVPGPCLVVSRYG